MIELSHIRARSAIWAGILPCLILASCQRDGRNTPQVPEVTYGDPADVRGKAMWGREDVWIVLCEGSRETCEQPTSEAERRDCALKFSEAGWRAMQEMDFEEDETGAPAGEVWIEGIGRKSTTSGGFGHMGAHSCEVIVDDVTKVERGPPWLFEPPPPVEQ